MSIIFLVINDIKVTQAQSFGNFYVAGLPSLTGIVGAVHAWQRDLNQKFFKDIYFTGTSIYLRDVENIQSHAKFTPAREDQRAGNKPYIAATVDAKTLNLNLDLIISLNVSHGKEDEYISFLEHQDFKELILSKFFCGGFIESIGKINCRENFLKSLQAIPSSAFVIECAKENLISIQKNYDVDSLEALLRMCERGKRSNQTITEVDFFAVPLAVGFVALEDTAQKRMGARNDRHIYAEPVLGAGKLITVGRLKKKEKNEEEENQSKIFWKHTSKNGFFITKAFKKEDL